KLQELIYECTSLCACEQKKCVNRLVQYGPRNNLKIIYSDRYQSKGLTTKSRNIGRYLNHSCQPNCQIKSVRIDCPLPSPIFSKNFIKAGEELCFHYNEGII
ncbi:putative histone-lysine N-methyltransferase set-23, partial [Glossina fuscipes fuscipes]